MDERLLTEAFSKIKKQYNSIQSMIETSDKPDRSNLSIELYSSPDSKPDKIADIDKIVDQKQRMLMRIKHIERYVKFIECHIQKVTSMIADIPPYNVALEIHDDSSEQDPVCDTDWDYITEEVYSTLNIESDDEDGIQEIKPEDLFDDDDPPLCHEVEGDKDEVPSDDVPSDDDELKVIEVEIDNTKYYTTSEENGRIYHILADNKVGRRIGIFNKGVAEFY